MDYIRPPEEWLSLGTTKTRKHIFTTLSSSTIQLSMEESSSSTRVALSSSNSACLATILEFKEELALFLVQGPSKLSIQ